MKPSMRTELLVWRFGPDDPVRLEILRIADAVDALERAAAKYLDDNGSRAELEAALDRHGKS